MKKIKPTNETGKNPETEQEKEALPSFFTNLFLSLIHISEPTRPY